MNAEAVAADPIDAAVVVVVATSTHTQLAGKPEKNSKKESGEWEGGLQPAVHYQWPIGAHPLPDRQTVKQTQTVWSGFLLSWSTCQNEGSIILGKSMWTSITLLLLLPATAEAALAIVL